MKTEPIKSKIFPIKNLIKNFVIIKIINWKNMNP